MKLLKILLVSQLPLLNKILDTTASFNGILRSVRRTNLSSDSFISIPAGTSFQTTINTASVHDLSAGGAFTAVAEGAFPYALPNSTELAGDAIGFKSNALDLNIDGAAAALVPRAVEPLWKRAKVQSDCSTAQKSATTKALANCKTLANAAATAAKSGSASKFSEYFKTTSSTVRATVAKRLTAVASECGSSISGATTYFCTDTNSYCESDVLAYTLPSSNEVVNCPLYYSDLTALSSTCHGQDQATTTLHEFTHAPGVFSPGTDDNGYGYAAATKLSSAKAVLNADSYALYANGRLDVIGSSRTVLTNYPALHNNC